jgi:2-polyprenyl-3-methyl-5-hydroxy-6-metoxy-1,4-benzoquinol methylase
VNSAVGTLERVLDDLATARNYNRWLFSRARPYLGKRVLDVGAGLGTFSALAAAEGAEVVALEPESSFVAHLRERFAGMPQVRVVAGLAEESPAETGSEFDSILCLNVLEHVADHEAALARFRAALVEGGRLLLLVPAHERLYGPYDRTTGHVRRYRKAELRAALEAEGFDVAVLRHVNPVGALGWFVRIRLGRGREWPSTSFAAFDRLVPLLRPLDRLHLPVGLSLWAVASAARARASRGTGSTAPSASRR